MEKRPGLSEMAAPPEQNRTATSCLWRRKDSPPSPMFSELLEITWCAWSARAGWARKPSRILLCEWSRLGSDSCTAALACTSGSKPFLRIARGGDRADAAVMDPCSAAYRPELGNGFVSQNCLRHAHRIHGRVVSCRF